MKGLLKSEDGPALKTQATECNSTIGHAKEPWQQQRVYGNTVHLLNTGVSKGYVLNVLQMELHSCYATLGCTLRSRLYVRKGHKPLLRQSEWTEQKQTLLSLNHTVP